MTLGSQALRRANLVLTFPLTTLYPRTKEHKVDVPTLCQLKPEFGISTDHTLILNVVVREAV